MRAVTAAVLVLALAPFLQACAYVEGCSREGSPEFSATEEQITRNDVVADLGEPIETFKSEDGRVDIYEYDQFCGGLFIAGVLPIPVYLDLPDQMLTVEYGPDGSFLTAEVWPDAETQEEAITSYERRAEHRVRAEARELAKRFNDLGPLKELAEQGDRDTAFELAKNFDEPKFIRALAEQGDRDAAFVLAKRFNDLGPLKELAEQGDVQAIFNLYEQAIYRKGPSTEALKWLCEAASAGDARAQSKLAYLHRPWGENEEYGIEENNRIAYMWYTLAAASGADTLGARSIVAEEMTAEEEAEALEMVRDWKPVQCPGP